MADRIRVEITGESRDLVEAAAEAVAAIKAVDHTATKATRTQARQTAVTRDLERATRDLSHELEGNNRWLASIDRSAGRAANTLGRMNWRQAALGAGLLSGEIQGLTADLVALASTAGPALGALAALPGIASAALQGIGTLKLATSGLGAALKEQSKDAAGAGTTATRSANQQANAADQIATAQRGLTQARREARIEIQQLTEEIEQSRLTEADSELGLREAIKARKQLLQTPGASNLQIDEANQAVKDARFASRNAHKDRVDTERHAQTTRSKGVEGNDKVIAAEHELTRAHREQADALDQQAASADRANTAMAKLPAAEQKFAKFLLSQKPKLDELRETAAKGLFGGVETGIKSAERNLPVLNKVISETANVLGDAADKAGRFFGSKSFGEDFASIGAHNARYLGVAADDAGNLAHALVDVMVAAQPLDDWLVRSAGHWTENIRQWAQAGRQSGQLANDFDHTRTVLHEFGVIGDGLVTTLFNIGKAGEGSGEDLLKMLGHLTQKWAAWTGSVDGQNEMRKFFEQAEPALKDTLKAVGALGHLAVDLGKDGLAGGLHLTLQAITDISDGLDWITKHTGPGVHKALVVAFAGLYLYNKLGIGKLVGGLQTAAGWAKTLKSNLTGAAEVNVAGGAGGAATAEKDAAAATTATAGTSVAKSVGSKFLHGIPIAGLIAAPIYDIGNKGEAAYQDAMHHLPANIKTVQQLHATLKALKDLHAEDAFSRLSKAAGKLGDDPLDWGKKERLQADQLLAGAKDTETATRRIKGAIRSMAESGQSDFHILEQNVATNLGLIKTTLGADSQEGRRELSANFAAAISSVKHSMHDGTVSTKAGLREIRKLMREELAQYGIKGQAATNYLNGNDTTGKQLTGPMGHQRGGPINAGALSGDSVPAMLERGEYVLNRNAVRHVGRDVLDHINFGAAARFQTGGFVASPGTNFTVGREPQIAADLARLGHMLHLLVTGISGYRTPQHSVQVGGFADDPHTQGLAADIGVPGGFLSSAGADAVLRRVGLYRPFYPADPHEINHVQPLGSGPAGSKGGGAKGVIAQIAAAITPPTWNGPGGALGAIGQRSLDVAAQAAQDYVDGGAGATAGLSGGTSGANESLGRRMMLAAGFGADQWPALKALWTRESGWNASAVNPSSGAYGIPQALGHGHPFALGDARGQIKWGLDYIRGRYHTPAGAWAHEQSAGWYQQGGVVDGVNLDHLFPRHSLAGAGGHVRLAPGQVRALAEQAGLPGQQFEQIAHGESNYYPGIVSSDQGWGLWQMTPRVWGAKAQAKLASFGGIGQMLNPWKNAEMARYLYQQSGDAFTPWHGTHYLTDTGKGPQVRPKVKSQPKRSRKRRRPTQAAAWSPADVLGFPKKLIRNYNATETLLGTNGLKEQLESGLIDGLDAQFLVDADDNPDTPDVVNQHGVTVEGKFIPGIDQYSALQRQLISLTETEDQLKRHELTVAAQIAATLHGEVEAGKLQLQGLLTQITQNFQRIRQLSQERAGLVKERGAKGTTATRKNQIASRIARLDQDLAGLHREQRELTGAVDPDPGRLTDARGMYGKTARKVAAAKNELSSGGWDDQVRTLPFDVAELEQVTLPALRKDLASALGTQPPKDDTGSSGSDGTLAALLAAELDTVRQTLALSNAQYSTLQGLAPIVQGRYMGAFAHGGYIPQTGMALVHAGEYITPAPVGPYNSDLAPRGDGRPISIAIDLHHHPVKGLRGTASIEGRATEISMQQGRRARLLARAPGSG